MTYLSTITLNVELSNGGRDEKISPQYESNQRWFSQVDATPGEKFIDNVQETWYRTEVIFWEPDATQRPFPDSLAFVTGQFLFLQRASEQEQEKEQVLIIRANPLRVLTNSNNDDETNLPEWFAPVLNVVGHVGPLAKKHDSGMRSFDVQCTSYNPEASGQHKSAQFMLRCFFDTGKRWKTYEPPRAGTLVHIIGQLIGQYKVNEDKKPAVLITDFKVLHSSGNANRAPGESIITSEATSPTKRKYRPKSSKLFAQPITPENSGSSSVTITLDGSGIGDNESPNAASSPISRQVEELSAEEVEVDDEDPVIDSPQHRAKRIRTGKRSRKGRDSPEN